MKQLPMELLFQAVLIGWASGDDDADQILLLGGTITSFKLKQQEE